jgi:hypothetical protein
MTIRFRTPFDQRIMARFFGRPDLEPYMKKGTESDAVMVSEALIKACATARFIRAGEYARFYISDIARIAKRLTEDEEASDQQTIIPPARPGIW